MDKDNDLLEEGGQQHLEATNALGMNARDGNGDGVADFSTLLTQMRVV